MPPWVFMLAVFGIVLVAVVFISRYLIFRAISQVIRIFRFNLATNERGARTADELGLTPPSIWKRMMRTRDYKPAALNILLQNDIIVVTEDGRLYLSEDRLIGSRFAHF